MLGDEEGVVFWFFLWWRNGKCFCFVWGVGRMFLSV